MASDRATSSGSADARLERLLTPPRDLWLTLGLFVLGAAFRFGSTVDDPLITLRYAANLLDGNGPVFNAGERVEGFSSPLHLAVAVVARALPGGDDLLYLKLLSVLFGVLAIHRCVRIVRLMGWPAWARATSLVLIGGSWILQQSSANGLETSLTLWLLSWLLELLMGDDAGERPLLVGAVAGALVLARPEAIGLVACLAGAGVIVHRPGERVRAARWVAVPAVVAAGVVAARLLYYGEPLPNTYYAKRVPLGSGVVGGMKYVITGLFTPALGGTKLLGYLLAAVFLALAAVGSALALARRDRSILLVAVVVAQTTFILLAGGDWMPDQRFTAIMFPSLALLATSGSRWCLERVHAAGVALVSAGALLLSILLAVLHPFPIWASSDLTDIGLVRSGGYGMRDVWSDLPAALACAPPGSAVSLSEVGVSASTRLDLEVLDTRGLTDSTIAHGSVHATHGPFGVDATWYDSTTAVATRITELQPVVIVAFDGPADATTLAAIGYRETGWRDYPEPGLRVHRFARIGGPCDERP